MRKVLISPGFGAGWSTWNTEFRDDFLFDEKLIRAVENGDDRAEAIEDFDRRMKEKHGEEYDGFYNGGLGRLRVEKVYGPFIVDEYDGYESLQTREGTSWIEP